MDFKITFLRLWIFATGIFLSMAYLAAQEQKIPLDTAIFDAIDFNLVDIEGKKIDSKKLKGHVVVLNFWGVRCPPCRLELPELNQVVHQYSSKNIHFIGITADTKEDLKLFLNKYPFNYQVCPTANYQELLLAYNSFPAVPIHVIIDKDWQVIYRYIGRLKDASLEGFKQTIEKCL